MDRIAYYQQMKALARDTRAKHGVVTSALGLREMRKVYKAEGIKLDLWPHKMKKIRAAYFLQDDCAYVLLKKHMPDEPRLFSMAHELKHHLVDQDLARSQRLECAADFSSRAEIEIGAEVFAAEFLFPEAEFVEWVNGQLNGSGCGIDEVVRLKRACPAKVSYTFLVKRLERLKYAAPGTFKGVQFQKHEHRIFGVPFYLRLRQRLRQPK